MKSLAVILILAAACAVGTSALDCGGQDVCETLEILKRGLKEQFVTALRAENDARVAFDSALTKATMQNEVFKILDDIKEMKEQMFQQADKAVRSEALTNFVAGELHTTMRAVLNAFDEIKELQEQMQTLQGCRTATPKQCFV